MGEEFPKLAGSHCVLLKEEQGNMYLDGIMSLNYFLMFKSDILESVLWL